MIGRRVSVLLACAALAACGGEGGAAAHAECAGGAHPDLSVWAEHERLIGATFTLTGVEPGRNWRVVVVHEGRVTWRGSARAWRNGVLEVRRKLHDLPGADRISVRAYGPGGATCSASARLADV